MDPSEYKRRTEMEQQKLKRKLNEMYEYNVKAAEKAKKEILERRMLSLFGMASPKKKQRGNRAVDQIRSIREDEKAGIIDADHADEQCRALSFASYCDICRDYPRKD
jgi:hypothetical protein